MTHRARCLFPTLLSLERWATVNCANCRYISKSPHPDQPQQPCTVSSKCLSAWLTDVEIDPVTEDILFGDLPQYARAQYVIAPSCCHSQKDRRGRPRKLQDP